jgi:hypothetical protein
MAAPVYIISRVADPIFAVVIGLSAAALRINREEKDKGRSTQETFAAARRYVGNSWLHIHMSFTETIVPRRLGFAKSS